MAKRYRQVPVTSAPFGGSTNGREAKHGTQSGYVTHRAGGEDACAECKQAHAEYVTAQRARASGVDVKLPRMTGDKT